MQMQEVTRCWRVKGGVYVLGTEKEELELTKLLDRMDQEFERLDLSEFSLKRKVEAAVACKDCAGDVRWMVYVDGNSDYKQNKAELKRWIEELYKEGESLRMMNRTLETFEGVLVIVPSS